MTTTDAPPRWDLTPIYTGLDDRTFNNAVEGVFAQIDRLSALYEEYDIRESAPRPVTDADITGLESVIALHNELSDEMRRVGAYLHGLITTDSRNDLAAARNTELQTRAAPIGPLHKRLGAWLASLGLNDFLTRSQVAADHEFALQRGLKARSCR